MLDEFKESFRAASHIVDFQVIRMLWCRENGGNEHDIPNGLHMLDSLGRQKADLECQVM